MSADVVIDPRDKKYFVHKPDASFSPQRNAQIMREVHAETTKFFTGLRELQMKAAEEKIDFLATFADYKLNRGGGKSFEGYAGKALRTRLIGERLLEKVRVMSSVDKLQGRKVQI